MLLLFFILYHYISIDNGPIITYFANNDQSENVEIPTTLNNIEITGLTDNLFMNEPYIKVLTIRANINELNKNLCMNCTNLYNVNFLQNLQIQCIHENCFKDCVKLQSINLENLKNCNRIYSNAFTNCISLSSITLPTNLDFLGTYVFYNCSSLNSITFSSRLLYINDNCFDSCSFSYVKLPSGITDLYSYSFSRNKKVIQEFSIPSTLTSIDDNAFYDTNINVFLFESNSKYSNSLLFNKLTYKTLYFPDAMTSIQSQQFKDNRYLETVNFRSTSSLKNIGEKCFYNSSIKRVNFPSSLETIGKESFQTSSIETINIKSPINILKDAFKECFSLKSISIEISNTDIMSISEYAFYNCTKLSAVSINAKCKINKYAFAKCHSLHDLNIVSSSIQICSYCFDECWSLEEFPYRSIPEFILEDNAFQNAGLIEFNAPSGLNQIPESLFKNCTKLTRFFSENSQVKRYPANMFCNLNMDTIEFSRITEDIDLCMCINTTVDTLQFPPNSELALIPILLNTNVKKVIIPDFVDTVSTDNNLCLSTFEYIEFYPTSVLTKLEAYAFNNTKKLKTIVLPKTLQSIGSHCFKGSQVHDIYIHSKDLIINSYAFEDCEKLTFVYFDGEISQLTISQFAFYLCPSLKAISHIKKQTVLQYKYIGKYVITESKERKITAKAVTFFSNSFAESKIEEIAFENSKVIVGYTTGEQNYDSSKKILNITFKNCVLNISDNAFNYSRYIDTIDFTNSIFSYLGSYAFYNCKLKNISLKNSTITEIPSNCFKSSYISKIIIPDAALKINISAFIWCSIEELYLNFSPAYDFIFARSSVYYLILSNIEVYEKYYHQYYIRYRPDYYKWGFYYSIVEFTEEPSMGYIVNSYELIMLDSITDLTDPSLFRFCNCYKMTFKDTSNLTKIGSNVFQYCTLLSEIRFPPSLSSIGQGIFSGLSNLKTIEFSSNSHNLTTLITSEYSFCNIRSSFSFITNNRSISFQDNAFYNSAIVQLDFNFDQDITFSGSVFNCSKYLDSITIPDCITSITSTLFTECSSLRCIIFSPYSRLCSIESYSFSNTSIRTLYVPQQVQEIGSDIFNSSIISPVIYYAGASTSISSYSITSTIYVSNEYPGSIYQNMIKVSNKIINSKAYHCDVEPEESTLIYDNIKYSIIDNEKKEVIVIPDAYSSSSMSIPQSFTIGYIKYTVVGIKRCAFYNNRILNQITLSRELRFIEEYAFFNCTNLRYIYDLYAQSIGRYAFYGCKIITLSINSWNYIIGDYAFANCTDLEQISGTSQNDNYPREIGKYAFADCIKLTEAPCLDYVYCIHKGAFRNTSISSINIKKYTEIIEEGAFASCMKLSMFDAHNNNILTSISDDCFKDCVELKYVFLPEIIESIGNYSFFGCTKLYSINLYKVGSIGYHAFYDSPCFMVEFNGTIEPQFNSSFMCTNQKFYSDTYKSTSFCGICIANDCKCPDTKPKATNIPAKRYFCENQRILRLKF